MDEDMKLGVILFCAVIVSLLAAASPQFTGWIPGHEPLEISFSVAEKSQSCISIIEMPENVIQYQQATFMVAAENCGSVPISGKIHFYIINEYGQVADHVQSDLPGLNSSQSAIITRVWPAVVAGGNYWLSVRDEIDGNMTMEVNSTNPFTVIPLLCMPGEYMCFGRILKRCSMFGLGWDDVTICQLGCVAGQCTSGGGGGGGIAPSMYIEYPEEITINPGMNYPIIFRIMNTGNVVLNGIYILASSNQVDVRMVSRAISGLQPDDSAVFIAEITAPKTLEEGKYLIKWEMVTDRINRSGNITVNVTVSPLKQKSEQLISYYGYLIDTVDKEIETAGSAGKNVDEANNYTRQARYDLGLAKELHKLGMYQDAVDQLEDVRKSIRGAVETLTKAKFVQVPEEEVVEAPEIKAPEISWNEVIVWSLIGIAVCIAVLWALLSYRRKSKRRMFISSAKWEPSRFSF